MDEVWREIPGYEGYYEASNLGRVKRIRCGQGTQPKVMKTYVGGGYSNVRLCMNGKTKLWLVHRLVAKAFLPNPHNLPCVNHIDGIKTNNSITNLEWVSYSDNMNHSFENGLHPRGELHYRCKVSREDVLKIVSDKRENEQIAEDFGISEWYVFELKQGVKRVHDQS